MPFLDSFFFQALIILMLLASLVVALFLLGPKMAPQALLNLALIFLASKLWSLDFYSVLALTLVLSGGALAFLFRWDRSRNFSWSGHYILFVLQSLALALSPLAFYRGLQGPLPLWDLSLWTQGRQALGLLFSLALLIYHGWPAHWARPHGLISRLPVRQPYVYGQELLRWLESFPGRPWCQIWDQGLQALLNQDPRTSVHRSLDFFCMVGCPLAFLGLALWGLLSQGDLRWMLLAQPLQLLSFLYGQNQLLLLSALEDNKAFLETFLAIEIQQPSEANLVGLEFHWQKGKADLGPSRLQYYGRLWLSLGHLRQLWDSWPRPWTLLLVLRLGLALAILDPAGLLRGHLDHLQGPLLLLRLRPCLARTPVNARGLATRAYSVKKEYQQDLVEISEGEYAKNHLVGLNDEGKLDGNFTTDAQKRPNGIVLDQYENLKGQEKSQGFLVYAKPRDIPRSWLKYLEGSSQYLDQASRKERLDQGLKEKGPASDQSE